MSNNQFAPRNHPAQPAIHRFLEDGNYWNLAESFESLRTHDPTLARPLDRWQADAALLAGEWEAAWAFRALGLLESNQRITFEDVINVRARCHDRSLSVADLHLFILSDNGLTPWGNEHLTEVNAAVSNVLEGSYRRENTNPLQALHDRYSGRDPGDEEFAELADECDYLIGAELLKRHVEYDAFSIDRYQRARTSGADISPVQRQLHVWRTSPRKWCFQPTQGEFVEHSADGFHDDGSVRRRDFPRFPFTRPPGWISVAAEPFCQALLRRCENDVRRESGLPEIGGGWVSETELYRLVTEAFVGTPVLQHARPRWLKPQHVDVYLPAHNIALEYQGRQHFEAVDFFGGEEGVRKSRERDARKRRLCRKHGCTLVAVRPGYDPNEVVDRVRRAIDEGG